MQESLRRNGIALIVNRRVRNAVLGCNLKNDRMGKSRDFFKTIRDTKGKFPAKMGSIKDRNGMKLRETQNCTKKIS